MKGKPTMRETQITVVASRRSQFPIDMLRYDCCVPATESDAGLIRRTIEDTADRDSLIVVVNLRRFSPDGRPASVARWQSFGWGVKSDSGRQGW